MRQRDRMVEIILIVANGAALPFLIWVLGAILIPAHGQTCSVPSPAAAVGYDTQTLGSGVNVGSNWYPFSFFGSSTGGSITPNGNGSVTLAGGSSMYNAQIATATQGGQGETFGAGGYFQATLSFTGSSAQHAGNWPAFWANDGKMQGDNYSNWFEPDIMEMDSSGSNQYGISLHNWVSEANGGEQNSATLPVVTVPAGTNFAQPHTYGFLWVPATATSQGYANYYFDGSEVGSISWSEGSPYAALDSRQLTLILGTGPSNPMTVYSVQAWQNPATANDAGVNVAASASQPCAPVASAAAAVTSAAAAPPGPIGAPVTAPGPVDPAGITPGQGTVTDCSGNVWTLTASGSVQENGAYVAGGGGTSALSVSGCKVYGQDNGHDGNTANSGGWFALSGGQWQVSAAPGGSGPSPPAGPPTPPLVCGQAAASGAFRTVGGAIIGPDGQPFIARGLNLYDNQMGSAATMTANFTGLNFVRLNIHSYQDPSAYQAFVAQMTGAGRVVEFEDHPDGGGDVDAAPPGGMAAELSWYASMAKAYAGNPYVWFGTFNEPMPTSSLSTWQQQTYQAIRGAGNQNPILIEVSGSRPDNLQDALNPSVYATMTNVIWDVHLYGYQSGYSTDAASIASTNQAMITAAQTIKSADGIMPVIIGEFGPSTDGTNNDPNGMDLVNAVVNLGGQNQFGSGAWGYDPGGAADHVTSGGQVTSPYGQTVQIYINTSVTPCSQQELTAAATTNLAQLTAQVTGQPPPDPSQAASTPPVTVDTSASEAAAQQAADAVQSQVSTLDSQIAAAQAQIQALQAQQAAQQ